jgi:fructosamine-3-kinase
VSGGPGSGLAGAVAAALGSEAVGFTRGGGGSISEAGRVDLRDGRMVFAKSAAGLTSGQLGVEAEGLRWLGEVDGVPVPEVLAAGDDLLVLSWIPPGPRGAATDELLGRALARLHASTVTAFGWHRDGFIGREPQRNTPLADDWPTFWFERRVAPLVDRALRRGALDSRAGRLADRMQERLPERAGPAEPPVRVHGDLWTGNVHVDGDGRPWLVDPAPYGGHREADLAMLHLFGAPGRACMAAYAEALPLADGWRDRLELWQLEPVLNHAVMFGGHYGSAALRILQRWA